MVAQPEYTPEQMRMLLGELAKHPELQTGILHHVTQHHITDPQAIAALMHEQLQAVKPVEVTSPAASPLAALVGGMALPKFEVLDMNASQQKPAQQAIALAAPVAPVRDAGVGVA